jgi:Rrf2 family protein
VFTQTIEYALRAVAYLARQPDKARTTEQIAAVTLVPPNYLAKVLGDLARAGFVASQRGLYGGFRLSCDPAKVTVLDIVNAVGSVPRIRDCPLALPEHADRLCRLHALLDQAAAQVEQALAAVTITELVEGTNEHADFRDPLGTAEVRMSGRRGRTTGAGARRTGGEKGGRSS